MNTLSQSANARLSLSCGDHTARRFSLFGMLALWRSRRALAALTPDQLNDIGVSPGDAAQEASRPVWDVPAHWRD